MDADSARKLWDSLMFALVGVFSAVGSVVLCSQTVHHQLVSSFKLLLIVYFSLLVFLHQIGRSRNHLTEREVMVSPPDVAAVM